MGYKRVGGYNAWQPEFSASEARESLGLSDGFDSERGDKATPDQMRDYIVVLPIVDLGLSVVSQRVTALDSVDAVMRATERLVEEGYVLDTRPVEVTRATDLQSGHERSLM